MKKTLLCILALTLCVSAFAIAFISPAAGIAANTSAMTSSQMMMRSQRVAQAITPDPKPAATVKLKEPLLKVNDPVPVQTFTVDEYNKLKSDLATAQQQGALALQYQQLAEYRGVLAERNQLGIQLLQTQAQLSDVTAKLNDANKEIQSLRDKLAAHEKDSPKK